MGLIIIEKVKQTKKLWYIIFRANKINYFVMILKRDLLKEIVFILLEVK